MKALVGSELIDRQHFHHRTMKENGLVAGRGETQSREASLLAQYLADGAYLPSVETGFASSLAAERAWRARLATEPGSQP